jgi:hypothetical protein
MKGTLGLAGEEMQMGSTPRLDKRLKEFYARRPTIEVKVARAFLEALKKKPEAAQIIEKYLERREKTGGQREGGRKRSRREAGGRRRRSP